MYSYRRYSVEITISDGYSSESRIVNATASTREEALGLLDHQVKQAWASLQQSTYAIEAPTLNNIETK